ncbi:MAG TPA: alpha/beta hydrolase [Ktedonobacterales bacterium]|jgi:pimeloyl-ACP methyl ester carboxylesterase
MSTNPRYVEAEARIFGGYKLSPSLHTLSLARSRLRLRVMEVGVGETVVFLHGFSHCVAHWVPLASRIAGARCLMLDAPGHGEADAVNFNGVDLRAWYKEMLTSCLDALGLEQARLIGHSQGAMQALWLALDAPDRVRSVVAIGTPAAAFGAQLDGLRLLARPGVGPLLFWLPLPPSAYRNILAGTMGPTAVRAYPDLVRATYLATHRAGYAKTVSSYLREMFRGADAEPRRYALSDDELRRIAQPALVLWGDHDTNQPIEEAKVRAALAPHSRFEIVSGGHEPWLDDLNACATLISAFHAS